MNTFICIGVYYSNGMEATNMDETTQARLINYLDDHFEIVHHQSEVNDNWEWMHIGIKPESRPETELILNKLHVHGYKVIDIDFEHCAVRANRQR